MSAQSIPPGATLRSDSDGEYVHFHKLCKHCSVDLTSRNRVQSGAIVCRECFNRVARERAAIARTDPNYKPRRSDKSTGVHIENPDRQKVHQLLTRFLCNPTSKAYKDVLLSELVTYEIRERMRCL